MESIKNKARISRGIHNRFHLFSSKNKREAKKSPYEYISLGTIGISDWGIEKGRGLSGAELIVGRDKNA